MVPMHALCVSTACQDAASVKFECHSEWKVKTRDRASIYGGLLKSWVFPTLQSIRFHLFPDGPKSHTKALV